jgi:hypothetical protein
MTFWISKLIGYWPNVLWPLLEQELDGLLVASIWSRLQRIAILSALCVDIGPILEQPPDNLVVTLT